MCEQVDGKSTGRVERREEKDRLLGAEAKYCLVTSDHHKHLPDTVYTVGDE